MDSEPRLTPEQVQVLQEARERARGILKAAKVAAFNGWTIGVLAALTALFGLTSPVLLGLAAGMGVVARNEFRGRALLRSLEPAGPVLLTRNQLGFMALIVAYCAWCIARAYTNPDPDWALLQDLVGLDAGFVRDLIVAGYAGAILLTAVFVGLNARYYHRRKAMLADYLASTPAWVLELQRTAAVD